MLVINSVEYNVLGLTIFIVSMLAKPFTRLRPNQMHGESNKSRKLEFLENMKERVGDVTCVVQQSANGWTVPAD